MIKIIYKILKFINQYPFKDEDFNYPCQVFSRDFYSGHYGCIIQKTSSGDVDPEEGDIIIWSLNPSIHPKLYISKKFKAF